MGSWVEVESLKHRAGSLAWTLNSSTKANYVLSAVHRASSDKSQTRGDDLSRHVRWVKRWIRGGRVTIRDPVLCSVTFFRSVNLTHIVTNLSQMESLHNEPVVSTPPETFFR